jgi:hypothetical protein
MSERIKLGIRAVRKLNPHPERFARYYPHRRQYVQIHRSPTDDEIESHIRGTQLLGAVSSDDQGMTSSVGLDLDAHTSDQKPDIAAKRFIRACDSIELPTVIHTSKSGKGFHIRTLFKGSITSWLARALFVSLAIASGIAEDKALDKVWPPTRGYGVLALPYQSAYAKATGGSQAVDRRSLSVLEPGNQIEAVTDVEEVTAHEVESILQFLGVNSENEAKIVAGFPLQIKGIPMTDGTDGGIQDMVRYCRAVRKLHDEASSISYEFWFGMMTNFKPFSGGREIFEAISELDTERFDLDALNRSWKGISGKPRLCTNLDPNWTCPMKERCDAKSPAGLPFAIKRSTKES